MSIGFAVPVTGESGAPLSRASTAPPLDGAMTETVDNLKSELDCEERQQLAWLRRRLHAAILRARMWDEA